MSQSPKLVSIIIPSYNHEPYIEEAVRSALNQTHTHCEVIVIDDCSQDNSYRILKNIKDNRLKIFQNRTNLGVCASLNLGLSNATGDYIATIGSDDMFEESKIEKQISFLEENPRFAGTFTCVEFIDKAGKNTRNYPPELKSFTKQSYDSREEFLADIMLGWNTVCASSSLIRKSVYEKVGAYDQRLLQLQDYDMWMRILLEYPIEILQEPLTKYRVHQDNLNLSAKTIESSSRISLEHITILKKLLINLTMDDYYKLFPTKKREYNNESIDIVKFLFAQKFLRTSSHVHWFVGLETLFELMGNPQTASLLGNKFNFTYKDLWNSAGERDLFSLVNFHKITSSRFFVIWQKLSYLKTKLLNNEIA